MASSRPGELLSLPKGGALGGLGETFSPDLFTGTGNFTVPIALPPGRNGFQPQLRLVYGSGAGNGPFGLGWSISVPGVSRRTSRGIPRYRDDPAQPGPDVFVLSGSEDSPAGAPSTGTSPSAIDREPRTPSPSSITSGMPPTTTGAYEARTVLPASTAPKYQPVTIPPPSPNPAIDAGSSAGT
jgi:Salmonella virulence plasmid 65kDa B protein